MAQDDQGRYRLKDAGDYLMLRWTPGITMEAADVSSSIAAVTAASPDGRRPLLVHIDLVHHVSMEAKQLLIQDTCSSRTAIIGADAVSKVLSAFSYRSVTPSRYFADESSGVEWLLGDLDEEDGNYPGESGRDHSKEADFSATMHDGVLWVTWADNTSITGDLANELVRRTSQLNPITCPPMLAQLNQMVSVTEQALRIIAKGLNVSALAVVGLTPGDRALTAYYKHQIHPPYETRHFDSVEEAQRWLINNHSFSADHEVPYSVLG